MEGIDTFFDESLGTSITSTTPTHDQISPSSKTPMHQQNQRHYLVHKVESLGKAGSKGTIPKSAVQFESHIF